MHGKVGSTIEHGALYLFDEHTLPTDLMQGYVRAAIAGCLDENQLDLHRRVCVAQRRRDYFGLRPGLIA